MLIPRLKVGDHVRVIAPAHSFAPVFTKEYRTRAEERLGKIGLTVSYGKYVDELDDFKTATVEHRLEDLHEAFADPNVQVVIPARGGSTSNQLLKYIDYDLIKKNPKILCGLSDITAISYAMYVKTGIINYYGPHFTMLGTSKIIDYSLESMERTFFSNEVISLKPSGHFCDTTWDDAVIVNEGYWTINEGIAEGESIGGNLLTTNLIFGSQFMPDISGKIIFFEENKHRDFRDVQNDLQAVLNQPDSDKIKGLIFGHFQKETGMTRDLFTKIIKSKKELEGIPVVANLDFGHTIPLFTFPVGGYVKLEAKSGDQVKVEIIKH